MAEKSNIPEFSIRKENGLSRETAEILVEEVSIKNISSVISSGN